MKKSQISCDWVHSHFMIPKCIWLLLYVNLRPWHKCLSNVIFGKSMYRVSFSHGSFSVYIYVFDIKSLQKMIMLALTHTLCIIFNVHNFLFVSLFPIGLWVDWCPLAWFRCTNAPVTKIYFLEEDESDCENKHFSVKKEVENDHLISSFLEFS